LRELKPTPNRKELVIVKPQHPPHYIKKVYSRILRPAVSFGLGCPFCRAGRAMWNRPPVLTRYSIQNTRTIKDHTRSTVCRVSESGGAGYVCYHQVRLPFKTVNRLFNHITKSRFTLMRPNDHIARLSLHKRNYPTRKLRHTCFQAEAFESIQV